MSVIKPIALAGAFVVALSSFASAATARQHRHVQAPPAAYGNEYYNADDANTNAAEHFQNQFKNTY